MDYTQLAVKIPSETGGKKVLRVRLAVLRTFSIADSRRPLTTPMIVITTSSSISVKPHGVCNVVFTESSPGFSPVIGGSAAKERRRPAGDNSIFLILNIFFIDKTQLHSEGYISDTSQLPRA